MIAFRKLSLATPPNHPETRPRCRLRGGTLTNLYNQRPAWLDNAHKALDSAVTVAYGWTDHAPEMPDGEILRRLLSLNLQRSGQSGASSS